MITMINHPLCDPVFACTVIILMFIIHHITQFVKGESMVSMVHVFIYIYSYVVILFMCYAGKLYLTITDVTVMRVFAQEI